MNTIDGITFKYQIGDIIETKKGSYRILDRNVKIEKNGYRRPNYVCQCLIDGYIFNRRQNDIDKKHMCPICSHNITVLGYNTVFDLRPDLIKYFVNIEDAKKYAPYSNKKVWMKCPICGEQKYMQVNNLTIQGFACPICSDGISYPNKFIRNFLKQLHIHFIPEHSFNWLPNRLYDEYLPELNMIIENHGEQHYDNRNIWGVDNIANDTYKKTSALDNGIKHYIELDCSESSMIYIKNSILNSELPLLLHFTEENIDWKQCELAASGSLLVQVCDLYNKGYTYNEIMNELNISYDTAHVYLRRGRKAGLASALISNEYMYNDSKYRNTYNGSPVYCVTDDIYFSNLSLCSVYYKDKGIFLCSGNINRAIKNSQKAGGKCFRKISKIEFNNLKDRSLNDNTLCVIGEKYNEKFLNI